MAEVPLIRRWAVFLRRHLWDGAALALFLAALAVGGAGLGDGAAIFLQAGTSGMAAQADQPAPAGRARLTMSDLESDDARAPQILFPVQTHILPAWLRQRILGNPVNNLGAYVRPQYRDVTYFYGIDFHQDLIDYKAREADFLTLYIYLHPVTLADAPLYLLEGSHRLGGSVFPHDLSRMGEDAWRYANGEHGQTKVRQRILTGGAGYAAMWHACTLHGTQPDAADHERVSLRYLVARRHAGRIGLDEVNARLRGPLSLADTRADLAADGSAAIRRNTVNQA